MNKLQQKLIPGKFLLMAAVAAMSTAVSADHDDDDELYYAHSDVQIAYGKVLKVTPVYREVRTTTPVKECWQEPVTRSKTVRHGSHSAGATLAGGLIGGIIGHQFGKGRGQKLSTAMGTLIGAQLGHDSVRNGHASQHSYVTYENVCEVENQVSYEEVLDSYKVTYRYNGKKIQG